MCLESSKLLTTKEVSKALKTSESTIKRWIDKGKIKAHKTLGGHRRVNITDLYSFINNNPANDKSLSYILGEDFSYPKNDKEKITFVKNLLIKKQENHLDYFVKREILEGKELSEIIDKNIYQSYLSIRKDCQHPSPSCSILHKSFDIITKTIGKHSLNIKPETNSEILMADIGYPIDGLQTYLYEYSCAGLLKITQLGTNIEPEVLLGAVKKTQPKYVFISGQDPQKKTSELALDQIFTMIRSLRRSFKFGYQN